MRQAGRRDERHALKRLQRALTEAKSGGLCYLTRRPVAVDVGRALVAHVTGPHRCGSPWSCPLCTPVVRQRRALEIDAGLTRWLALGGGAEFVTFTCRHHRKDTLSSRLDPITQSLRITLDGAAWKRRRDRLGFVGSIKAPEITYGRNGWHAHAHVLMLFDGALSAAERDDFQMWLLGRWSKHVMALGLGSLHELHGIDMRGVSNAGDLGQYLTVVESAWSPGMELARLDLKSKGITPFDLLRECALTGDAKLATLWREFETATFGKRAVVWSRGLRARLLGDDREASDVELATSEGLDLSLLRAVVPIAQWNQSVREGRTGRLLTEIEQAAAALLFLADVLGQDVEPLEPMEVEA